MIRSLVIATCCIPLLAGCATQAGWSAEDGRAAEKIEVQVDSTGAPIEIEYHINPGLVPQTVHAAMNELYPDGAATGAEKEYHMGVLYWELSKEVDGRKVEAMFRPDGTLQSEEIEVAAASVPDAVKAAVSAQFNDPVNQWEEVTDSSRTVVEYHAKLTSARKDYKILVSPEGMWLGTVREVLAEVEVPVE